MHTDNMKSVNTVVFAKFLYLFVLAFVYYIILLLIFVLADLTTSLYRTHSDSVLNSFNLI